jgi:hypothetical protein
MVRTSTWQYRVDFNNNRSSALGAKMSFRAALATAVKDATYYAAIRKAHRRFQSKPCPDCRGNAILNTVGPVPCIVSRCVALSVA